MKWFNREEYFQIMNEINSKLTISQGNVAKVQVIVKTLIKEKEDLMVKIKAVESKAQDLAISKEPKGVPWGHIFSKKKKDEEFSTLKDELVDFSTKYWADKGASNLLVPWARPKSHGWISLKWYVAATWWGKKRFHLIRSQMYILIRATKFRLGGTR